MEKYILSIDQGTTSTRVILFDKKGCSKYSIQKEISCLYPEPGWVEQSALEIWQSVVECITGLNTFHGITSSQIDSIAITNQRETTIVWDKKTGMPVYNAIVWQSRQTADICEKYSKYKDLIHQKTGLIINPYFSASKIRFILDHIPNGQKRAENGELMFGTVDSWLIYKITKDQRHETDVTNASRTLLFNINTLSWDDELLKLFNIPKCILPNVLPSSSDFGTTNKTFGNIPIYGVAGDQQAALFGQNAFNKGDCKSTYGTGCFLLANIGDKPVLSKNGLLTTIAWQIGDKVTYALEGSIYIGGSLVQWLRDGLEFFKNAADSEELAYKASDNSGIYVIPAFTGLGSPYWDDDAKGAIFGLTRGSNKKDIIKASLEAIAYQCEDVYRVMLKDASMKRTNLHVDGGATENNYLMQFQSNISGIKVIKPRCKEITALGAAYLAGLYSGFYKDIETICNLCDISREYIPLMNKAERARLFKGYKVAIKATRMFKL